MSSFKSPPHHSLWILLAAVLLVLLPYGWKSIDVPPVDRVIGADPDIEYLIQSHAKETWVETTGSVSRILPDDREGSAHQRFILRLASGRTVLIAHNIDLAHRVPLQSGDTVRLRGRYEWNSKGGVIHWTHHDPNKRQSGGWIEHSTIRYQ